MEKSFDAPAFINEQLLSGTEEFFANCDVATQAKWVYRSLLRLAVVVRMIETVLGQFHILDDNLHQAQVHLVMAHQEKESAEEARVKAEKSVQEAANEVQRLKDLEMLLRSEAAKAETRVMEAKKKMKVAEALVDTLRKRNKEVVRNAKETISATKESLKLQVALLAPNFDISRIGAFKTIMAKSWTSVLIRECSGFPVFLFLCLPYTGFLCILYLYPMGRLVVRSC
ncbi:hypothetical protein AHAS_Ahas13G0158500 [Arachis hypogaea]